MIFQTKSVLTLSNVEQFDFQIDKYEMLSNHLDLQQFAETIIYTHLLHFMCCFSQGCFFSLDWPFTRYYCWYNVAFKAAELVHVLLQRKSCEYKQRVRAHVDSAHFPLQQTVCCVDSTQSQTTLSALNFFNLPATLPCNICLPDVGVLSSHESYAQ